MDSIWELIANAIKKEIPGVHALICFGSRIIGTHSEKSDYDLIVIAERDYGIKEQIQLEKLIGRRLKVKVHMTLISPKTLKAGMRMSPYIQVAVKSGVVIGEIGEVVPLSKLGVLNEIDNIRLELNDPDAGKMGLLRALRSANYLHYLLVGLPDLKELHDILAISKRHSSAKIRATVRDSLNRLEPVVEVMPKNKSDIELEVRICG